MAAITFTASELSQLTPVMASPYNYVPPSGDPTGVMDRVNIQAAIDRAQASTPLYQQITPVHLCGLYRINGPIVMGAVKKGPDDYASLSRVTLHGIGHARIELVAPANPHDYMIRLFGACHTGGTKAILSNLSLQANRLGRGILCATTATQSSIENVSIQYTIESSLDLIMDWCCNLRSVFIDRCQGFAMRCKSTNNCHFDSVFILGGDALVSTDPKKLPPSTLYKWANSNGGIAEAIANYPVGAVKAAQWPASDDALCTDAAGTPFVTTDEQRCCLFLQNSNGSVFTNLGFEQCGYVDYPLIYGDAPVRIVFNMLRTEAVYNRHERVLLNGAKHVVFNNVATEDGPVSSGTPSCPCFLRLKGITQGNRVNYLTGTAGLTDNIIIHDGGNHEGTICTHCATEGKYIPTAKWIGETNNAVVNPCWNDRYVGPM